MPAGTRQIRTWLVALVIGVSATGCSNGAQSPSGPSGPPSAPVPPVSGQVTIRGVVTDSAFRPQVAAVVVALDGPDAGRETMTDGSGWFAWEGQFDDSTRFRATSAGHLPGTATPEPTVYTNSSGPFRIVVINLAVADPPARVAGDYTLTFLADPGCRGLPDHLRSRSYAITIGPDSDTREHPADTLFRANTEGGSFWHDRWWFPVGVAGGDVHFLLADHEPYLVEDLGANSYFAIAGHAYAAVGAGIGAELSTPFDGLLEYASVKSALVEYYYLEPSQTLARVSCVSKNHQMTLKRRG